MKKQIVILSLFLILLLNPMILTFSNINFILNENVVKDPAIRNKETLQNSNGDIIYSEDFNDTIHGEIPVGWIVSDNPPAYNYFRVYDPLVSSHSTFMTKHLAVVDSQSGSSVYGYTSLPEAIEEGSFEFDLNVYLGGGGEHSYFLYLNDEFDTHIITIDVRVKDPVDTEWTLRVEGQSVGVYNHRDEVYVKVLFTYNLIDVFVNGTQELNDISYTNGIISKLRIESTVSGGGSEVFFDNFQLTKMEAEELPILTFHEDFLTGYWDLKSFVGRYFHTNGLPDDTYVRSLYPNNNYQTSEEISITWDNDILLGNFADLIFMKYVEPTQFLSLNQTGVSKSQLYCYVSTYTGTPNIGVYTTSPFNPSTITWNTQPSDFNLVDEFIVSSTGTQYWDLGIYHTKSEYYAFFPDTSSYSSVTIRSAEHSYGFNPRVQHHYAKNFYGDGMMYMQTNEVEPLWLVSPIYSRNFSVKSGDMLTIQCKSTTSNEVSLQFYSGLTPIKEITIIPENNSNFEDQIIEIILDEDVEFDQLAFYEFFDNPGYFKCNDLKIRCLPEQYDEKGFGVSYNIHQEYQGMAKLMSTSKIINFGRGIQENPPFDDNDLINDDGLYDSTQLYGGIYTPYHRQIADTMYSYSGDTWGTTIGGGLPILMDLALEYDDNEYLWVMDGLPYIGLLGMNFGGYSNFYDQAHPGVYEIRIDYEIMPDSAVGSLDNSYNLQVKVIADDSTESPFFLIASVPVDEVHYTGTLILNDASSSALLQRVRDGGYVESIVVQMDCNERAYINVDYIDIYYYYTTYQIDFTYELDIGSCDNLELHQLRTTVNFFDTIPDIEIQAYDFISSNWVTLGTTTTYNNELIDFYITSNLNNYISNNDLLTTNKKIFLRFHRPSIYEYQDYYHSSELHVRIDQIKFDVKATTTLTQKYMYFYNFTDKKPKYFADFKALKWSGLTPENITLTKPSLYELISIYSETLGNITSHPYKINGTSGDNNIILDEYDTQWHIFGDMQFTFSALNILNFSTLEKTRIMMGGLFNFTEAIIRIAINGTFLIRIQINSEYIGFPPENLFYHIDNSTYTSSYGSVSYHPLNGFEVWPSIQPGSLGLFNLKIQTNITQTNDIEYVGYLLDLKSINITNTVYCTAHQVYNFSDDALIRDWVLISYNADNWEDTFADWDFSIPIDDLDEGHYYAIVAVFDSFSQVINKSLEIWVDRTNPITTLFFIPHNGTINVNASTIFILNSDDGVGSGISVINYRINNSVWINYSIPFTLNTYSLGFYNISYFAIDNVGNIENVKSFLVKLVYLDITVPTIILNLPNPHDLYGKIAPVFNIRVIEPNLDCMWYTLDNGLTNKIFVGNESIDQTLWNEFNNGTVTIKFYANDTFGNIAYEEVILRKDVIDPVILINNPIFNQEFSRESPAFNISVDEPNLDLIWYTIDDGITNITISELIGTIDETLWNALPNGSVKIIFYANDTAGNITSEDVTVIKTIPNGGLEPTIIIIIIVISSVGAVAIAVILYIILKKRKARV